MYYYYQLLFLFLVSDVIDDVARFLHDQGQWHRATPMEQNTDLIWHRSTMHCAMAEIYNSTMLLWKNATRSTRQRSTKPENYYGRDLLWHTATLAPGTRPDLNFSSILHHCHFYIFKHTTRSFRIYPDILTTDYEPRASFDVQDNL